MIFKHHLAEVLATGGYVGRSPIVPGTVGSLVGIPFVYAISFFPWPVGLIIIVLFTLLAVWSAQVVERQLQVKDPGCVVIDEIAGMMVTMLGIPFTIGNCVAGFLLFRIFDIVKPPPARQLERRLSGGWGIVMDDIVAGVMANIAFRIGLFLTDNL